MNTRVLISDDEQGICHILRHELEQVGFVVSVSNNGKQTKQFLDEQSFDVLLLDIQMPGCDGFQVLDHLKTVRRKPGHGCSARTAKTGGRPDLPAYRRVRDFHSFIPAFFRLRRSALSRKSS